MVRDSILNDKIMFISKGLQNILNDRDIRKSQNQQLKKACEAVLERIGKLDVNDAHGSHQSTALPTPKDSTQTLDEETIFVPFELACQTKSNRIVIIALDCIQKLIAYGHLTGSERDGRREEGQLLVDSIVEAICNCFNGPNTDTGVELQIIKALLTIVTSQHCPVHEGSILLSVRTCYNIYLASKNETNQKTAIATLRQMLSVIFKRMESFSLENDYYSDSIANCDNQSINGSTNSSTVQLRESNDCNSINVLLAMYTSGKDDSLDSIESIVGDIIATVCKHSETMNGTNQSLPSKASSTITTNSTVHSSHNLSNGTIHSADSFESNDTIHLTFDNIYQKDAYLVFRSLCKLSMKPLADHNVDKNSHELRSKILSLQLILSILQDSGEVFQNSDMFAVAIKQYLCVALSKNGVSNIVEIFDLSLNIFLALLQKFKTFLKMQIEVFFKEIFLNILETVSSSFRHKWLVIEALTRICADAQSVVDIYVNYDCDLSSENIFGRLVNDLSKIAQGGAQILDTGIVTPAQERNMRLKGLECLVSILKCMVEWSSDLYISPEQQIFTNNENEKSSINSNSNSGREEMKTTSSSSTLDRFGSSDNPERFEEKKNQKNLIDKGTDLFNINPKKGIEYLQHQGLLDTTAEGVAQFFHANDRLDKSLVGEYMGDFNNFNKEVMYAYVDQMDFSDRDFVSALRYFLEGFRLPGEAQKIDRFMEKFASRYFQTNMDKDIFTSADTAYVLAYSIIMLTTDLHSPQVKKKMTKEDYIKLNRGINESKDLPESYLSQIYDLIAESEIKMKGNNSKRVTGKEVTSEKARRLLYNMEMETMAQTAKALMESVSHVESPFTSAKHLEHVRPMFRTAWTSFLAAFSVGLQDCDDGDIAGSCLDGIRCAIRIACIFQMSLERDAFVQALARFTLLNANGAVIEMKTKNIDTIKTLITVAYTDGNYLGKSWLDILRCISQLELAQLIGTGAKPGILNSSHIHMNGGSGGAFGFQFNFMQLDPLSRGKSEKDAKIAESMMEASSQSVVVAVDRIFTSSVRLDGVAIVDFVRALCQVSSEELSNVQNPRMFSLQKIVEISYYNMSRIRLQWSRIWEVLGEHFNKVGCNANEDIAFFAIDALRQLSMKFIEKGEFSNFRFQKDFLRPFEYIMKCNNSVRTRDLVVQCISQMVNSQASNIKSGWKNIFNVFRIAAGENNSHIFNLAFQTTCNIFNNIYESNFISMIDSFQDAIKCLSEFGCNQQFPDTSMEAIRLIRACARYVAEQPQCFKEFNVEDKTNGYHANEDDRVWVRGWLPILFELSCIVNTCKLDVRTRALTVMFEIIKSHGQTFRENWWTDLFKVIFRILKVPPSQQVEKNEWMDTTCNHALYSIVDIFTQYFDMLGLFLLKDVYSQLFWCVQQNNEQLARSGINCFENLVISCGVKYDPATWTMTLEFIERTYEEVLKGAEKIYENPAVQSLTREQTETLKIKLVVLLDLVQSIDNIVFYPSHSRKEDLEVVKELEVELKQRNLIEINDGGEMAGGSSSSTTLNGPKRTTRRGSAAGRGGGGGGSPVHPQHIGMYSHISTASLLRLAKFLGKVFDTSNQLYLDKSRHHLLADQLSCLSSLEIKSLLCAIRILFNLYNDRTRQEHSQVEGELVEVNYKALKYYNQIENEYNRENWNTVVLYILFNVSKLDTEKFKTHIARYFGELSDMLLLELKPTLKVTIRRVLVRLGHECLHFGEASQH